MRTVVPNQKMNRVKPDGFAALGMLAKRYNPKTPSTILHALTQVLSPPTVKDVRQASRMVEEWEAAKGQLKVEFGEEFSKVMQIAILTKMLPSDLQDKVFEMVNAGDLNYLKVRDAIVGIMKNRARVLEPTPMDIGQVGGPVRERESRGQLRLGWRRRTVHFRCLRCGGFGHFARECPTPVSKGKGKGAKGGKGGVDFRFKGKGESVKGGWGWYGKSGFTDNGLGKGNKGKSGGKGYQGICWLCGEVGHKAAECGGKGRRSGGVEAVEEEEVVADVGGVWTIASVEKGRTKAKGWRRPTKKEAALRRRSTEVAFVHKNKFGVLEVDCGDLAVYALEASAQVREAESFGLQAVDRPLKLVNASEVGLNTSAKGP